MYCIKCGNNLPSGANFCPRCGKKQGPNEDSIPHKCVSKTFGGGLIAVPNSKKLASQINDWLDGLSGVKFVRWNFGISRGFVRKVTLTAEVTDMPKPYCFQVEVISLTGRVLGWIASVWSIKGIDGLIDEWTKNNSDKRIRSTRIINDFGQPVEVWILYTMNKKTNVGVK